MSKAQYYQQLSSAIDNALLHLYCQIAITERFVPIAQRNTILSQFLKPKIKNTHYKIIKGDIKRMVLIGQRPGGNIEAKLNELRNMTMEYKDKMNGAQHLFDLLNHLFDDHGFDSRLFDNDEITEKEVIYIIKEHLEHCFEPDGQQIAPISLCIQFEKNTPEMLLTLINQTSLFIAELKEYNALNQQAHILLHPINKITH
ncbi:hypothetical protein C9J21_18580 [Photobacterium phosphoreum]|uniref:DUF2913 family protein n=1 Tax=Photobacterium phosphoreum TaxID=659 RepID=UPI000D157118|nr:DUF2913 family protein [Photobacterium phosphoreum]PSW30462.1 hypothetical protein C9J21_18580 [Photobacterium phosphoreum]